MNTPDCASPVTSELSLPCVYGTTVLCQFSFLYVMLHVVWARAYASIQMANILCRLHNHDYGMAINIIIVIMSYTSVGRLAARTSRFLPPFVFCFCFCFCGYIAFVLRSTAIPAVRIPVFTLYSKLTCSYRNVDVSVIYIMLIQQSTGTAIRGMTPALSLRGTSS